MAPPDAPPTDDVPGTDTPEATREGAHGPDVDRPGEAPGGASRRARPRGSLADAFRGTVRRHPWIAGSLGLYVVAALVYAFVFAPPSVSHGAYALPRAAWPDSLGAAPPIEPDGRVAVVEVLMRRGALHPGHVRVHKCRSGGSSAESHRLRCRVVLLTPFGQTVDRSATFDVRGGVVVRGAVH